VVDEDAVRRQLLLAHARALLGAALARSGREGALGGAMALGAVQTSLLIVQLAEDQPGDSAEADLLWQAAADVASAFADEVRRAADVEMLWPIASALARACVIDTHCLRGEGPARWRRLEAFLRTHDGPHLSWELTAIAIQALLDESAGQELPPWLLGQVLGDSPGRASPSAPAASGGTPRNPALVCRVLLRHGRTADALDLALAGMARALKGQARWLTPGLLDQLHAAGQALARSETGPSADGLALRVEQLKDAARTYLLSGE